MALLLSMLCTAKLFAPMLAVWSPSASVVVGELSSQASVKTQASNLLGELLQRFALQGFSLGGQVALEMWWQAQLVHATLPSICVPSMVLNGALDAITPPAKHAELTVMPRSQRVELSDAGHMQKMEAPQACAQADVMRCA